MPEKERGIFPGGHTPSFQSLRLPWAGIQQVLNECYGLSAAIAPSRTQDSSRVSGDAPAAPSPPGHWALPGASSGLPTAAPPGLSSSARTIFHSGKPRRVVEAQGPYWKGPVRVQCCPPFSAH